MTSNLKEPLIYLKYRLTKRFVKREYLRPTHNGDDSFELYWGSDVLSEEEQSLLWCYAASSRLKYAFGERTGQSLQFEYGELATRHAKIKSILPHFIYFSFFRKFSLYHNWLKI